MAKKTTKKSARTRSKNVEAAEQLAQSAKRSITKPDSQEQVSDVEAVKKLNDAREADQQLPLTGNKDELITTIIAAGDTTENKE